MFKKAVFLILAISLVALFGSAILYIRNLYGIRTFLDKATNRNSIILQPPREDTSGWKTYRSTIYNYSFRYPFDWGIGSPCENENRAGFVGIGPELLNFPTADCGTANIPPTMAFYIDSTEPLPITNYKILEKRNMSIDGKEGKYVKIGRIDRSRADSDNYMQFTIQLDDKYLVVQTGAYPWPTLESDFQDIIGTIKINVN